MCKSCLKRFLSCLILCFIEIYIKLYKQVCWITTFVQGFSKFKGPSANNLYISRETTKRPDQAIRFIWFRRCRICSCKILVTWSLLKNIATRLRGNNLVYILHTSHLPRPSSKLLLDIVGVSGFLRSLHINTKNNNLCNFYFAEMLCYCLIMSETLSCRC